MKNRQYTEDHTTTDKEKAMKTDEIIKELVFALDKSVTNEISLGTRGEATRDLTEIQHCKIIESFLTDLFLYMDKSSAEDIEVLKMALIRYFNMNYHTL